MTIQFAVLPERPHDWDKRIAQFASKTLFHESAWHTHVLSIHPNAKFEYFAIRDGDRDLGFFCALRVSKFLLRIYGSPLPGTGTNYMGPVVNHGVDQHALLRALLSALRMRRAAHVEFATEALDPRVIEQAGVTVRRSVTHLVPLPDDESGAWSTIRSSARNRIKKAEKSGLSAEVTDDPRIVEHFYNQFQEVYGKQELGMPFGIDRPRSLFDTLLPAGRLLPIWVKHEGRVVAAGLFPFDEHCVYFWGAASWLSEQHLCPNELLHWTVIREAVKRGIRAYNMCGGRSQFKDKFGGEDVPYNHYSKSFLPLLGGARDVYQRWHFRQLRLRGAIAAATSGKVRVG